jgi:glycerophosphoryl diester phosphodiesterase
MKRTVLARRFVPDSGNLFGEIAAYRKAGIDGLFTDNTDIAVAQEAEAR